MRIRAESPADHDAVASIHLAAFQRPDLDHGEPPPEAALVRALRADPGFVAALSLVAVDVAGTVVGHSITTVGAVGETPVLGLGPIGVAPAGQRDGVGSALLHATIGAAIALGYPAICLLGSTDYYPRFGFVPASAVGITAPDPIWGDHFQALVLDPAATPTGTFRYAAPFDDLDD